MNDEAFQHEYDPDDPAASYQPINGFALLAIVLAILGLISIAFPFFVFLSIIAAVAAIIAIRQITLHPRYVGSKVAQVALFIAVFSATISLGYTLGRAGYVNRTAAKHARTIVDLLASGRHGEAYEYSKDPLQRLPKGTDLVYHYGNTDGLKTGKMPPKADILGWIAVPPLSIVEADERKGTFKFVGHKDFSLSDHTWETVGCVFKYEPASRDLEASTFSLVMMRKDYGGARGAQWRFLQFEIVDGPEVKPGMMTVGPPKKGKDGKDGKNEAGSGLPPQIK